MFFLLRILSRPRDIKVSGHLSVLPDLHTLSVTPSRCIQLKTEISAQFITAQQHLISL